VCLPIREKIFIRVYFVGNGKCPVGAGTLGVHAPLGDHFTVEVGEFFPEPDILEQLRAPWTCGQHLLIIDDRATGVGGQFLDVAHKALLLGHGWVVWP
jgi:hypothetical protein